MAATMAALTEAERASLESLGRVLDALSRLEGLRTTPAPPSPHAVIETVLARIDGIARTPGGRTDPPGQSA